jgi:hypothetical protein
VESNRKEDNMMKAIAVTHVTESRKCDFDAFIERFESQLGTHDISAYRNRLGDTNAPGEVEAILKSQEGSSGLMLFSSDDQLRDRLDKLRDLRILPEVLRKFGISSQRRRSWCVSTDPEFAAK